MTNFLQPIYLTSSEVMSHTTNNELRKSSTDVINSIIVQAQIILDDYIGDVVRTNEEQDFKFPINGQTIIPKDVKTATLYLVENIFIENKKNSGKLETSESWDGYSVSYFSDSNNVQIFNSNIKILLKKYGVNKNSVNKNAFRINY